MEDGLPFEMKQPRYDTETEADMKEARAIRDSQVRTKRHSSPHALFKDWIRKRTVNNVEISNHRSIPQGL